MTFVYIKLVVVGASFSEGGFATVQTAPFNTVGNLIEYACKVEFRREGVVSSQVKLYVAGSVDGNDPTPEAERAALSTSRLQVGRKLNNIEEGLYLLAVVEATHIQGKHHISAHAPPHPT